MSEPTPTVFWPDYFLRANFTEFGNVLERFPLGVVSDADSYALVGILQQVDKKAGKDLWTRIAGTEWSVYGAEVVYNGPNHRDLATMSKFKFCLGLKFPASSTAPVGRVNLCWN